MIYSEFNRALLKLYLCMLCAYVKNNNNIYWPIYKYCSFVTQYQYQPHKSKFVIKILGFHVTSCLQNSSMEVHS